MAGRLALEANLALDGTVKGTPSGMTGDFANIARKGLSLLDGDLPLPVALLRESALIQNRTWMRAFLARTGAKIAPHGKTPMSPALAQMQMQDGAWGVTAATAQQAAIFAAFGIRRIILANRLVGRENIRVVIGLLEQHLDLDLWCLVDSADGARILADAVRAHGKLARPLRVLIEIGAFGARTGVRDGKGALVLARDIEALHPWLALSGVEAYEGVFGGHAPDTRTALARQMVEEVATFAHVAAGEGLFADGTILMTAGGTEFFDLAAQVLSRGIAGREVIPVIRSGCYVTHDHLSFAKMFERMVARDSSLAEIGTGLTPALEVWAAVPSQPEPGLAFATMGKRDVSYDIEMPLPVHWFRPERDRAPQPVPPGVSVTRLNDQHAFLHVPHPSPFELGDLIGFGVSHVCTTFDKWRSVLLVDDEYRVTGAIRTYF
ncbi:alanine racemase [Mesorhizobium sp. M1340]|uniref:alanine racemase n=1 Tax=Mesorhizobium sp. M1340 TaxID=2957087 RepID=UPI003338B721